MLKHAASSVTFFLVALALFSTPLVLKYKIYAPVHDYIIRGDEVLLRESYPNFWCEAEGLSSDVEFNAYGFKDVPPVDESTTKHTVLTHHVKLSNKAQEYWGFHLLKGTNVSLWSCVKLSGASITLVRGKSHLHKCLAQYKNAMNSEEDSLEESSESESEEATSSISSSQGVLSNETDIPSPCTTAIEQRVLASNYRCSSVSRRIRRKFMFSYQVPVTDYYFFVFLSDTYLDIIPNEFSVKLGLERTSYSKENSLSNCTMSTTCEIPLRFGTSPKILLQLPTSNGTLEEKEILLKCEPRKSVFFLFYLGFIVMLFVCAFQ